MKTIPWLVVSVFLIAVALVALPVSASDHDFNGVVEGLEHHYGIHGQRVPMMGLASFCARLATHGGVKGVRIAEFDHAGLKSGSGQLEADDMTAFVGQQLGTEWQPIVRDYGRHGKEQTVIFVRPLGHAMRMLIVDYEGEELDVVRVELDGAQLARWMNHPSDPTRGSRHGVGDSEESGGNALKGTAQ